MVTNIQYPILSGPFSGKLFIFVFERIEVSSRFLVPNFFTNLRTILEDSCRCCMVSVNFDWIFLSTIGSNSSPIETLISDLEIKSIMSFGNSVNFIRLHM